MRIMIGALLLVGGCNGGADAAPPPAERSLELRDFTAVELAGPDRVDIRRGPAFQIRMRGDAGALERMEVRRDGDTLRIARKSGSRWQWNREGVTVHVTMPDLRYSVAV